MSEIKPCPNPWCKGALYLNEQHIHKHALKDGRCWIDCYYCSPTISTDILESESEALAAWNTRPIEDELRAKIAELEGSLDAALKQYEHQVSYNAALEQWQREAVEYLQMLFAKTKESETLTPLYKLIKQAEEK